MPRALPPIEGNKGANISPSLVESVAGFSAGVVSCLTVHPLDLLKNRLQRMYPPSLLRKDNPDRLLVNTQAASRPGDSFRIFRHVVRDEGGIRALYRGLWPNMLGNSLGWGLYFVFYRNLKDLMQARRGHGEYLSSAEFFSASIVAGLEHHDKANYDKCLTAAKVCSPEPAQTPSGLLRRACSSAAQTIPKHTKACGLA